MSVGGVGGRIVVSVVGVFAVEGVGSGGRKEEEGRLGWYLMRKERQEKGEGDRSEMEVIGREEGGRGRKRKMNEPESSSTSRSSRESDPTHIIRLSMLVELRPRSRKKVQGEESQLRFLDASPPSAISPSFVAQTHHLIASSPSSSNPLNLLLVNLNTKNRPAARAATPATTLIPMIAPVESPDDPAGAAEEEAEAALETEAVLMTVTTPPAELVDCSAVVEVLFQGEKEGERMGRRVAVSLSDRRGGAGGKGRDR